MPLQCSYASCSTVFLIIHTCDPLPYSTVLIMFASPCAHCFLIIHIIILMILAPLFTIPFGYIYDYLSMLFALLFVIPFDHIYMIILMLFAPSFTIPFDYVYAISPHAICSIN